MLKAAVSIIDFCTRFAYFTVALALLISGFAVHYTVHHFAISTDTSKVFSKDVPWLQRKNEFDKLFSCSCRRKNSPASPNRSPAPRR